MKNNLRRIIYAMLLGVFVYAGFAIYSGVDKMGEALSHYRWSTFAMACTFAFGNYVLRFFKWEFYLSRLEIRGIPKLDSFLTFLSGFVLTVTPGKVGEIFKSLVLHEIHGYRGRIPLSGPERQAIVTTVLRHIAEIAALTQDVH